MLRRQSVLKVKILLDPVPGWGNDPQDHVQAVQRLLDSSLGHYLPTVELVGTEIVEVRGDSRTGLVWSLIQLRYLVSW